jgi:hypothetical protein
VLHLQSFRRTSKYASFLKIRAPCIWIFLLCRLICVFLRVHLSYFLNSIYFSSLHFPSRYREESLITILISISLRGLSNDNQSRPE